MTTNIIGRVTGGERSNIYGTIETLSYPGANLFLINPAGVVFGPSAKLDVAGSFHVTTAGCVRAGGETCSDPKPGPGLKFFADPSRTSVLTADPPAAFGFLGPTPAKISVQGSFLAVPPGQSLSFVGGDVEISGAGLLAQGRSEERR